MSSLSWRRLVSRSTHQTTYERALAQQARDFQFGHAYPFISIVLANWNGKSQTLECLDSLDESDYPKNRAEIVVCDNGSSDGSPEAIRAKLNSMRPSGWTDLELIENRSNLGATTAINQAIKVAKTDGDYVWKIDNDIVVAPDALRELVRIAEADNNVGMVGGKSYYHGPDNVIWFAGGKVSLWLGGRGLIRGKNEVDSDRDLYANVQESQYLPGNSLLVSRRVIESVGLLDETYFVYFDDADWCVRAAKAGFKVIYAPASIVWHKVSRSTNIDSGFFWYHRTRNSLIFVRKTYGLWGLVAYGVVGLAPITVLELGRLVLLGKAHQVVPYLKGLIAGLSVSVRRVDAGSW